MSESPTKDPMRDAFSGVKKRIDRLETNTIQSDFIDASKSTDQEIYERLAHVLRLVGAPASLFEGLDELGHGAVYELVRRAPNWEDRNWWAEMRSACDAVDPSQPSTLGGDSW